MLSSERIGELIGRFEEIADPRDKEMNAAKDAETKTLKHLVCLPLVKMSLKRLELSPYLMS